MKSFVPNILLKCRLDYQKNPNPNTQDRTPINDYA
jgi:hypothetical protein